MYLNRFIKNLRGGFTLIELLIVVAIIAILAAIAVPNFLEAQTRAKVSRAKADMRTLATGMESYRVDNNELPPPLFPESMYADEGPSWWGFVPPSLTTPVSYLASMPVMTFIDTDDVLVFWELMGGTGNNQPYTYVYDLSVISGYVNSSGSYQGGWSDGPYGLGNYPEEGWDWNDSGSFFESALHSSYFVYTSGPDNGDWTVYGACVDYDPTNGTTSFGDIYRYGEGTADATGVAENRL